ncbi:MAG TPA: VWA domain-containing protein [Gaiellaceae bacterium]|nr:VWA domain-containing protein [Gaiellaceae bacterium]
MARSASIWLSAPVIALLGALVSAGTALSARPEIQAIDASGFPSIRVTVLLPAQTRTPPTLSVNGAPAVGLTTVDLGEKESVALVLDRSQSMHGRALADGIRAAETFVAAKPNSDEIGVFTAASHAVRLSDFSASQASADDALNSLSVDHRYGTALWDAVVLAANRLRTNRLPGRAIILVTDGQETTSTATLQQAIRAAQSARARVYTIGIPDTTFTPTPLIELATATGGRYYRAPTTAAFTHIYGMIAAELNKTWQLQFLTAARPGDTLRLTIRADSTSTTASERLSNRLGNGASTNTSPSPFIIAALAIIGTLALILLWPLTRSVRSSRWLRGSAPFWD